MGERDAIADPDQAAACALGLPAVELAPGRAQRPARPGVGPLAVAELGTPTPAPAACITTG